MTSERRLELKQLIRIAVANACEQRLKDLDKEREQVLKVLNSVNCIPARKATIRKDGTYLAKTIDYLKSTGKAVRIVELIEVIGDPQKLPGVAGRYRQHLYSAIHSTLKRQEHSGEVIQVGHGTWDLRSRHGK